MIKLTIFLALLMSASLPAIAADAVPTDASIRQLLEVTEARKLVEGIKDQVDGAMKSTMQQTLKDRRLSPEQQQVVDNARRKAVALTQNELDWNSLEPLYLRIYRESFTQEEIDGMLALYRTPAGQALIRKMPLVMQKSAIEMQGRINALMGEMRKVQQESLDELRALSPQ